MAYDFQSPQYACSFGMSNSEFNQRCEQLSVQHYRPLQVISYDEASGVRYAGIWMYDVQNSLFKICTLLKPADYQSTFDDLNEQGYKLLCVTGADSASTQYTGLWESGVWQGFTARNGLSASEFQTEFDDLAQQGHYLVWVSGNSTGSASSYAGIWSKFANQNRRARHNVPIEAYQGIFDTYQASGYRIAHFNAHSVGTKTSVAAIWIKQEGYDPHARHNMTECQFENELERRARNDERLICVSGYQHQGETQYASIWVKNSRTFVIQGRAGAGLDVFTSGLQNQMIAGGVTAASLAVTHNSKLVLAQGFGNITDLEPPVAPAALFRIASVSKAITGAAIIKLIEQKKLSFEDKLLDLLGWNGDVKGDNVRLITVDHLLHHVAGWNLNDITGGDPMFNDVNIGSDLGITLPISQQSIFRWTTTTQTLSRAPGIQYYYSNYGFMLLGMIIESVTGERYEDFVMDNILAPLGIRRMRCGAALLQDRAANEVTYHEPHTFLFPNVMTANAPKEVMQQYGSLNLTNMAPHGGWFASAVDLAKFASAFDDPATCPILTAASVQTMLTRIYPNAQGADNIVCGWSTSTHKSVQETYKTGGFNGTDALLYRRSDGVNAAIIMNRLSGEKFTLPCEEDPPTPSDLTPGPTWNLLGLLRNWVDGVKSWPSVDMWSEFL